MRSAKEIEEELKRFWSVSNFRFEAQYAVNRNGNGYFWNLRNPNDSSMVLFPNQKKVTVGAPPGSEYEINESYLISAFVAPEGIRKRFSDDYVLFLDTKINPPKKELLEAKSFIYQLNKEYNSVKGIGLDSLKGAINRIATDIHRKPETFIFELLQNADDYPFQEHANVEVSFQIIDEYLLFRHNGRPFKANNVRAVCSVDAGDKTIDFEKIGYKGIGFKSIFKHSNYVLIDSGEFTFRFDEAYHLKAGKDTFWQLIPIWTEKNEIPDIINLELKIPSNVNIIIKPEDGFEQLISYEDTFNKIFKDERVLLFLRNVSVLKFQGKDTSFIKRKDSEKWLISDLPSVPVPDEIVNRINNSIGKDDRIPEKYKDIDSTKITFSTELNDGKISKTENTRIYAYLPTDLNFGFPFLLNGDFIPDGGRHYLHADLEWNQFLFEQTGTQLLQWISKLWESRKEEDIFKMIPPESDLIIEKHDNEKEILLSHFKKGVKSSKEQISFIPCTNEQLKNAGEIILDDTDFFNEKCLGYDLFYEIYDTKRFLPLTYRINDYLKIDYLELEKFSNQNLIESFNNPENHLKIKGQISVLNKKQYENFLLKLNALSKESNDWILTLPFIKFDSEVISLPSLIESKKRILNFIKISDIKEILIKSEFLISDIGFDAYSNLFTIFQTKILYINDNQKLNSIIEENGNFAKLEITEKNELLEFLFYLPKVGIESCKKLKLFKSRVIYEGLKPLNSLISSTLNNIPKWLNHLIIDPDEEKHLSETFKNSLIIESQLLENIYCNTDLYNSIILKLDQNILPDFYNHLLFLANALPEDSTLSFNNIPWVFCSRDKTFKLPSVVYCPDSLSKLEEIKFKNVSFVLKEITTESLPLYDALKIIKPFKLGCKKDKLKDVFKYPKSFNSTVANDFLDWVNEDDFFENFKYTKKEENYQLDKSDSTTQYYTSNIDLIQIIEDSDQSNKLNLLPVELYNKERIKIGLLDG